MYGVMNLTEVVNQWQGVVAIQIVDRKQGRNCLLPHLLGQRGLLF